MRFDLSTTDDTTSNAAVEQLKKDLSAARQQVKTLMSSIDFPTDDTNNTIPTEFSCNICFEQYDKDERRPLAPNCGHIICEPCLLKITGEKMKPECPSCKRIIGSVVSLYF